MKRIVTGLDIGTSKVCAAIVTRSEEDKAEILGVGITGARGVNKGFVSNLDKLVDSVSKAVQSAEEKAGLRAHEVVVNISGASVLAKTTESAILLSKRGREITRRDTKRAIDNARNMSLTMDRDLLYSVPLEFTVDDDHVVENPLGLFGTKLKVKLYAITALRTHIQNISKAVSYAGYELLDIIPGSVAIENGMLKEKERSNGAIVLDIGGGVTEVALFYNNIFRFLDSVNVGGMDLTSSLSSFLKVPFTNAEKIKRQCAAISDEELAKERESLFDVENRQVVVKSREVNAMMRERFDEISHILDERLRSSELARLPVSNVIVTGGGALMNGALERFEKAFNIHVRMGRVHGVVGDPGTVSNPRYSTSISLAKYGLDKFTKPKSRAYKGRVFVLDTVQRFREMLDEYF